MCNEGTAVTKVCHQRYHLHGIYELLPRRIATLQAEGEERAGALGAVDLVQGVGLVLLEAAVAHPADLPVLLEELCDCQGVLRVLLHAQVQRLHAHGDQEGVEGADAHAHVAQAQGAGRDDECEARLSLRPEHLRHRPVFAEGLVHLQAVVGVARLREDGKLAGAPVEVAPLDDEAAHRIAMAAEALGGTVHDDVGAVLERPDEVGGGGRVVHDERDALRVRDLGQLLQVHNKPSRISNGLAIESLRLLGERFLDGIKVIVGAEGHFPTELLELASKLCHGASVELVRGDEVVTGVQEVAEGEALGSMARGHCESRHAPLQCRDLLLQGVRGGICDASVDGPKCLQGEFGCCIIGILEDKARAHRDGGGPCACGGVRLLPCIEALSSKLCVGRASATKLLRSSRCLRTARRFHELRLLPLLLGLASTHGESDLAACLYQKC
mmetsp:Transcript_56136/g.112527  ORF Transcript_56136/g.112527 Transcript_56136/m.112527 type:complete len:441 (+) Transcript_56136:356-1678(+)